MADFYGTAAGYNAYHTARGSLVGTPSDATILAALQVASEWGDATYRTSFPGLKVGQREQVREWPRTGACDIYGYAISSDAVPVEMESATYEAAAREIATPGSLSTDYTPSKYDSASIDGALAVKYRQFDNALEAQTKLMIVDRILAPILTAKSSGESLYSGRTARG